MSLVSWVSAPQGPRMGRDFVFVAHRMVSLDGRAVVPSGLILACPPDTLIQGHLTWLWRADPPAP
jgi:hypothetical protein